MCLIVNFLSIPGGLQNLWSYSHRHGIQGNDHSKSLRQTSFREHFREEQVIGCLISWLPVGRLIPNQQSNIQFVITSMDTLSTLLSVIHLGISRYIIISQLLLLFRK